MNKNTALIWKLSLLVIAIVSLVWAITKLFEIPLPDFAVRIMGILDIIAIPVFVYTSIKKSEANKS